MGYSHLLSLEASLANFRATYNVPRDVDIAYYHEEISTFVGVPV